MASRAAASTLAAVARAGDQSDRSRAIARQRLALGMSKSELAKLAHVDRATLDRIESGRGGRDTSLAAVERALADFDAEVSPDPSVVSSEDQSAVVRFVVRGVYGAEALIVEGPVENIADLEASVDRIMRRLRGNQDGT